MVLLISKNLRCQIIVFMGSNQASIYLGIGLLLYWNFSNIDNNILSDIVDITMLLEQKY